MSTLYYHRGAYAGEWDGGPPLAEATQGFVICFWMGPAGRHFG